MRNIINLNLFNRQSGKKLTTLQRRTAKVLDFTLNGLVRLLGISVLLFIAYLIVKLIMILIQY